MDSLKLISWPQDQDNADLIGGKAAALGALADTPLASQIPPWFALTKNAFTSSVDSTDQASSAQLSDAVQNALQKAVDQLVEQTGVDTLFAVRSSAIGEDGANASYAGQLKSFLNVKPQNIEEAVLAVWQSAFETHIHTYQQTTQKDQQSQTLTPLVPAVLVQAMVPARVAGVGFSVDPVSGDAQQMVISACEGLGESLVSGQVNGDTYYCSPQGECIDQICEGTPLLNALELKEISQLLKSLESHFKTPQDVEWAYADKKLWLLQSRPITTLSITTLSTSTLNDAEKITLESAQKKLDGPKQIGTQKILWDNSNIVESYSGVTSPLTFSFARYIYEHVYTEFCRFMGVGEKRIAQKHNLFRNMLGNINGHVYYNLLNWYEWLSLFPGFTLNRRFMEQMMGVGEELPEEFLKQIVKPSKNPFKKVMDALRVSRSAFGLFYNALVIKYKVKTFNKRLDKALSKPASTLATMPLDELATHYRNLEQQLLKHWDAPLINDFLCMMAFGLSRKLLEKHGGEKGLAYHRDMLIGQGDIISAEPAKRIRAMAEVASKHPELTATLSLGQKDACWQALEQHPEIKKMVESYLAKFGDRCLQELKLESPTMDDEPGTLFSSIGHLATRLKEGRLNTQASVELPPLTEVIGQGWWRNKLVGKVCVWAKNLVSGRENLRFERTRLFGRIRQIFIHKGRHFKDMGLLQDHRDIFYLEVNEILGLIEGTSTFYKVGALVEQREKEYTRLRQLPPPPSRLVTEGAVFANMTTDSIQQHDTKAPVNTENALKGIACCQGVVRATVRVITDPRNAELKAGEIMVAQFTDPGWITLFANAAGILIERGSLLSHSAIVARELNIPAIVGLKNIMQWLKTGDVVEMDGGTGVVTKVVPKVVTEIASPQQQDNDHDSKA